VFCNVSGVCPCCIATRDVMRVFLAVLTVAVCALVGGIAAFASPMSSIGPLPGSSAVVPVGYSSCWWKYGCKYCRYCNYYGSCSTVKQYCKQKRSYYY